MLCGKCMVPSELLRVFYWTFDVGRSMLDVHFFILAPLGMSMELFKERI